jgi:hypothetical protein
MALSMQMTSAFHLSSCFDPCNDGLKKSAIKDTEVQHHDIRQEGKGCTACKAHRHVSLQNNTAKGLAYDITASHFMSTTQAYHRTKTACDSKAGTGALPKAPMLRPLPDPFVADEMLWDLMLPPSHWEHEGDGE